MSGMTTEVLLNLVWLLIAVGLFGAWRLRWVHQLRHNSPHRIHEWSAIALALALLFFAVSISDDMHAEIVALEECSANRRDHAHLSSAHHSEIPHATSQVHDWLITAWGPANSADLFAFAVWPVDSLSSSDRFSLTEISRAPPFPLL
jgi:hypothetical protein